MANNIKDEMNLPTICETERSKNKKYIVIAACFLLTVLIAGAAFWAVNNYRNSQFHAPEFDPAAVQGVPEDLPDNVGYSTFNVSGIFDLGICGVLYNEDGKVEVDLTNISTNDVWLSILLTDSEGNYLGETGIVKPGEYVKYINIDENKLPENSELDANMKVRSYEPETYYSKGSVNLNVTIQN